MSIKREGVEGFGPAALAAVGIEGRVLDGLRWEVLRWEDIDYLARVKADDFSMDFEVYEVVSWGFTSHVGGTRVEHDTPLLHPKNWRSGSDTTEVVEESEPLFDGRVKWDGCTDWAWHTDDVMWHTCGPEGVSRLTEAMRRVYALAAERIDGWRPDL